MSQISVDQIVDVNGGNAVQINGMTPTAESMQGFRNRIINGDMRIDQRNNGASVNSANGSSVYAVDRFVFDQSAECVIACQRVEDAPSGFVNSLRMTVSTPDASIGAAQYVQLQQKFEGFNVADLAWGTASAASVTLSFWVKSSVTGNYPIRLVNSDGSRSYPFYITINAADTWEYKTKTVLGPTSGTFSTGSSLSFSLGFSFAVGSNYSGATPDAWNTTSSYLAANLANDTGWIATSGATFYITGVQLEAGSVATPFERRPYTTELQLAQRYYTRNTIAPGYSFGVLNAGNSAVQTTNFIEALPVEMRATPTVTYTFTSYDAAQDRGCYAISARSITTRGSTSYSGGYWNGAWFYQATAEL